MASSNKELFSLLLKTYASTTNPTKLIEFLEELNIFLGTYEPDEEHTNKSEETAIAEHFQQALDIMDRMDQVNDTEAVLETMPYPAWFCDSNGEIPILNQKTLDLFGKINNIRSLPISSTHQHNFLNRLKTICDNDTSQLFNIVLTDSSEERLPIILTPWENQSYDNELILVRVIMCFWPEDFSAAIQTSYQLTNAEIEVLQALVKGYSSSEIAELRNTKIDTIRAQLKSMFRKTGTTSQIELVRLITGIISVSDNFVGTRKNDSNRTYTQAKQNVIREKRQIPLPEGRTMTVYCCGDPNGIPFIHIHGYIDHALLPEKTAKYLADANLLALCPVRCGFGDTSISDHAFKTTDNYIQVVIQDIKHMLDHFAIETAVFAGSYTGGFFAYAMAAYHEESVSEIIFISSLIPPFHIEDIKNLPIPYQASLKACQFSPQVIKYILKLYSHLIKSDNIALIWDAYFNNNKLDPDYALLASYEFRRYYIDMVRFNLNQSPEPLMHDFKLVASKKSICKKINNIPILSIRGEFDSYVTQQLVERQTLQYSNMRSATVKEAGTFVFFQKPEAIIKLIAATVFKPSH